MKTRILFSLVLAAGLAASAQAQTERPDQTAFNGLYKELVEINTTLSAGDCTVAARAMGKRLTDAGFPAADVRILIPDGQPKFGALAAVLRGTDRSAKPILLLGHLDVVEAKREDWARDPFRLIEEGGYFYARGSSDMKGQDAIWVDSLIRYKKEGYRPKRDIKLALTCGEETADNFNGVEYLLAHNREALDAAFALNEGGGGSLDETGKRISNGIQIGEKTSQHYILETTNPGGHSSRPVKDNAIYELTHALGRVERHQFPVEINAVTRGFFAGNAPLRPGPVGAAMKKLGQPGKTDLAAAAVVAAASPNWNAMIRTTCVATQIEGGHAANALPQRARATVNCRILPGHTPQEVLADLKRIVADPKVRIDYIAKPRDIATSAPALAPEVFGPAEALTRKMWNVPLIPTMLVAGTDGRALINAGIPTYGLSGIFADPDGGGMHGLNERVRVRSLYEGRDYLYELVKTYGG